MNNLVVAADGLHPQAKVELQKNQSQYVLYKENKVSREELISLG